MDPKACILKLDLFIRRNVHDAKSCQNPVRKPGSRQIRIVFTIHMQCLKCLRNLRVTDIIADQIDFVDTHNRAQRCNLIIAQIELAVYAVKLRKRVEIRQLIV